MNFDIKYTRNLQIFNFIKIKQVMGVFLGTQSQKSIAKVLNRPRCKLGTLNHLADKRGPQVRERKEEYR